LPGLGDAELVAFRISQHHMTLLRALTDVDVHSAEVQRPFDGLLLVRHRRAREIEVHGVSADLRLLGRQKPDPEPACARLLAWPASTRTSRTREHRPKANPRRGSGRLCEGWVVGHFVRGPAERSS
jgi:hypothetical protein